MIYAVIDTNVIVAAMMSKYEDSATVKVLRAIRCGQIKPVCSLDIVAEYRAVLSRSKFHFLPDDVRQAIDNIVLNASFIEPEPSGETLPDESDRVFYEVALAGAEDATRLVTGNLRHYPISPIVVTPAQMIAILEAQETSSSNEA